MKKLYAITAVTGAVLTALWMAAAIIPTSGQIEKARTARIEAENRLVDFRRIMQEFPLHFTQVREISRQKEILVAQLYSKDELLELFNRVRTLAGVANLRVFEVSPSIEELLAINRTIPGGDQPHLLNIAVMVSGSFPQMGRFVEAMENEKFYQGINTCIINSTGDGQAYPQMTFSFRAYLGMARGS